MKKAFQISLAGTLFHIEEDAYAKLGAYLESVKARFAGTDGADEIVRDIEARIAEQFMEASKAVMSMAEVDAVIGAMGTVEDIGKEAGAEGAGPNAAERRYGKKLYRDEDDMVIGGVASGLARYFGVDAVWVRVGFVVLTLITGFGILAYLLMWLIVPPARTAAQKLEMAGTPVNLETLSHKIDEVRERHSTKVGRIVAWPFEVVGDVFRFLVRRVLPIFGKILVTLCAIVGAAAVIGASVAAPIAAVQVPPHLFEVPMTTVISNAAFYGLLACAYVAVVVPALLIFLLAVGALAKRTTVRGWLGAVLGSAWLVAVMAGAGLGAHVADRTERFYRTSPVYQEATRAVPIAGAVTGLDVGDGISVTLSQGEQRMTVTGRESAVDGLSAEVENGVVKLRTERRWTSCIICGSRRVSVALSLPSVSSIEASSGSWVTAEAATQGSLLIDASSGAGVDFDGGAEAATIEASSGARIVLEGSFASTTLSASSGARIEAFEAQIGSASARASSGARIELGPVPGGVTRSESSGGSIDIHMQ